VSGINTAATLSLGIKTDDARAELARLTTALRDFKAEFGKLGESIGGSSGVEQLRRELQMVQQQHAVANAELAQQQSKALADMQARLDQANKAMEAADKTSLQKRLEQNQQYQQAMLVGHAGDDRKMGVAQSQALIMDATRDARLASQAEAADKAQARLEQSIARQAATVMKANTIPAYQPAGADWWEKTLLSQQAQWDKYYETQAVAALKIEKSTAAVMRAATIPAYQPAGADWWNEILAKQEAGAAKLLAAQHRLEMDIAKQSAAVVRAATIPAYQPAGAQWWEEQFNKTLPRNFAGIQTQAEAAAYRESSQSIAAHSAALAENEKRIAAANKEHQFTAPVVKTASAATKEYSTALNDAHSAARGLSGGLNMLWVTWGSTVPIIAGAALTATLRGIYEEGKKVEYQLAFVKGLEGGYTVTTDQLQSATAGSMFNPEQAAGGLRALAQSGLSAKDALSALPTVLNLATVGETSVAEAAYAATGVMKSFGLEVDEIGRVSDVMSKAAALSNASVVDMMHAFKYAAAASSQYGVTLEETGAALAVLSEKNIKGTMAGTTHMNMLRELYSPTVSASKAFKELGVDTQEWQRQGMSSLQMIEALRGKLAGFDSTSVRSFAAAVGGTRGAKEFADLLTGGTDALTTMAKKLEESKDFTKQVMLELANTVEGASMRLKQSLSFAFAGAFETAKAPIQVFLDQLSAMLSSEGVRKFLVDLANGLANTSRFLAEHGRAILTVLEAYAGFRVVSALLSVLDGLIGRFAAARASLAAWTVQQDISTQATVLKTGALSRAALQEAAYGVAVTENAARLAGETAMQELNNSAKASGLSGLSMMSRGLGAVVSGFGTLLAVGTLVVTMWELFGKGVDEARNAQDRFNGTIDASIRMLDKENERLALRKEMLLAGKDPDNAQQNLTASLQGQMKGGQAYVAELQEAKEKGFDSNSYRSDEGKYLIKTTTGEYAWFKDSDLNKAISEGQAKLRELTEKAKINATEAPQVDALMAKKKLDKGIADIEEQLYSHYRATNDEGKRSAINKALTDLKPYKGAQPEDSTAVENTIKYLQTKYANVGTDSKNFNAGSQGGTTGALIAKYNEAFRHEQTLAKAQYDSEVKYDDALLKDKLIGIDEFNAKRKAAEDLYVKTTQSAYDVLITKLGKTTPQNEAEKIRLQTERDSVRNKLEEQKAVDAIRESETRLLDLVATEAALRKEISNTVTKDIPALHSKSEQIGVKAQAKLDESKMGSGDAAALAAEIQVTEIYAAKLAAVGTAAANAKDKVADYESMKKSGVALTARESAELDRLIGIMGGEKDALAALKAARDADIAAQREGARVRDAYTRSAQYGATQAFKAYQDSATNSAKQVETMFGNAFKNMEDSLYTFATTGKLSFKNLADGIVADLTRMMIQAQITGPLFNFLQGKANSAAGGGGLFGSVLSSLGFGSGVTDGTLPGNSVGVMASYATGTDYVPFDMVAQIHRGEKITPADKNTSNDNSQKITVVNNFTLQGPADQRTQDQIAGSVGMAMNRAMRRNG
jgi:TP901 family phage tail tape measure protein